MKPCALVSLCLIALFTVEYVHSANILVLTFFSTKSRKMTYMPLMEELGKRGHNVTVVSPIKANKEMKNVREIFTFDADKLMHGKFDGFETKEKQVTASPTAMTKLLLDTCNITYELPHVKALLNDKFDLIFLQPWYNECTLGMVYRLQAPFIVLTAISISSFIGAKVGANFPSSLTPNYNLGYQLEMTFYERFMNLGIDMVTDLLMGLYYEPKVEKLYRDKLGDDIPSINEILSNASLVLSNGHFSLVGPKPYFPDIGDIGGIHSRPAKPIPQDLENFIQQGSNGFILFSMGSAIKGDMMPENRRKTILKVFSRLKQQVLWKWESETMPDLPKNVKLSKWLPQQDLLGHKDIKLFITHCGGGSTEEAVYHGVPLIGLPMRADQPQNAATAKRHGFLVELDWSEFTEQEFETAIHEVLNNPKYRDNVKRLSTIFKDRNLEPMETAIFHVEYVLRHQGAPQLRSVGRKLNFVQYHSIDVITAYVSIITIAIYLFVRLLKFLLRKCISIIPKRM